VKEIFNRVESPNATATSGEWWTEGTPTTDEELFTKKTS
jgi:hypothetical protein